MALERSSSADVAVFTDEVQKYDGSLYNKFSKDYNNKYVTMNRWRQVSDKFDMILDWEASSKLFCILSDHSDHMETTWSLDHWTNFLAILAITVILWKQGCSCKDHMKS